MFNQIAFFGPGTQIVSILVGIAVLTLGRKLFWLFVGAAGFVIGLILATQFLKAQPDWVVLVAALVMGFAGALLAVFIQKIAVTVAGFVVGGYALLWVLQLIQVHTGQWGWFIFIVGGIAGALLALTLFEAALITLSTLAGATLIVQATHFRPLIAAVLFIVLVLAGLTIQIQSWQQKSAT